MNQPDFIADDLNDETVSPERQKEIEETILLSPQLKSKTIIVTTCVTQKDWDNLREKIKVLREAYDKGRYDEVND